jgi:F-type H+-transporting ATPase subunit delta
LLVRTTRANRAAQSSGALRGQRCRWLSHPLDTLRFPSLRRWFHDRRADRQCERDVATDDPSTASVPGRYAAALFELAEQQNEVAKVEADLAAVQRLLDQSEDLVRLVRSPVFSSDEQVKALGAVLAKAGIGGTAANFVKLLARNRRLFAVGDTIKAYHAMAAKARGEVAAEVTSAHPLTPAQLDALRETLKSSAGKSIAVTAKVDPSLLGGLVVKIGSRMIDSSLRTKLQTLKVAMKGTA